MPLGPTPQTPLTLAVTGGTGFVGRALVARAETFFRDAGCIRMEVTSGLRREEAHGFYRSQGFGEIARHFVKRL